MLTKKNKPFKSPLQKDQDRKEFFVGLLSAVLLGLSFPPIPLPYLVFVALAPYFSVITKNKSLGEINRFTYFVALIFNITTIYWVGSWTPDADPFLMVAGSVLIFFNPLVFLIPSTLFYLAKKYVHKDVALFLLPWFWLFYEYIYSISDFKFPWLSLSNSLPYFEQYIQIADIIGAYGLTVLIVYTNIFVYLLIRHLRRNDKIAYVYLALLFVIIILPLYYGISKINNYNESNEKIKVGLIQPNLNPNKKWEVGNLDEQIDLYFVLSQSAIDDGASIVIWPETALPVYLLTDKYKTQTNRLQRFVDSLKVPILTGMPHANFYPNQSTAPEDAKPVKGKASVYTSYNSILFFKPNNEVEQYGKIKLVPFGEKVPLVDIIPVLGKWFKWNVGISSWNTGTEKKIFQLDIDSTQVNIGGVVCIETIYADFVAGFVDKGADFIAVVTNDSWYGNSSGPYQHKEISVLRAVENRRTVVRAANGGISCIINPLGKTVVDTEMFTKRILVGDVPLNKKRTYFTANPLVFPYISIGISVLVMLMSIVMKVVKKK
ncbi:MAG: apolipoprotein N-acyltransferase [Melioribacteraceae bacterium]